jgi:large subunit ribosomal protein L24
MSLKRDDLVVVISGEFRGSGPAKIVAIDSSGKVAEVDGVGTVLKHVKRGHPKSPQGGRLALPVSIKLSKIAVYCSDCARGVRTKHDFVEGVKRRVCSRCNSPV